MKNKKNKTLLIGILFTIFVVVSFCMPKVEKVSAANDSCDGTIVDYYFLFSEGIGQSNESPSGTTTRRKDFIIKYESDLAFDNLERIGEGKTIEVVDGSTTDTQWSIDKFWEVYKKLTAIDGKPGFNYYYDSNKKEVYASAVAWYNSDTDTELHTGVIVKDFTVDKAKGGTRVATGITDFNSPTFYPIAEAFSNGQYKLNFGITRRYSDASPALNVSNCPINVRYKTDGTTEDIPEAQSHYCYHNVVYRYRFCGTKNGQSTQSTQSTTPSPQSTESTEPAKTIYTLIYDLNYGEEKGKDWHTQKSENDNTFDIYGKRPTREGYVFSGWADTEDGEARYQPDAKNAVVTFPDGVYKKRIYAVWVPEGTDYTVTYDANGGQGAPDSQTAPAGTCVVISKEKPTLEGNTFLGWNPNKYAPEASSTYAPGTEYCGGDITLYAVWQPNTGIKDYAMVAGILALAAGAGLLLVKRTNIFKQI